MEASNYSRPPSERLELKYDKFTIKKDPKLRLKEVICSDDPCASCGGPIEKQEVWEQVVNVTGYIRVPRALWEECGGKIEENSLPPRSSEIWADRRENEVGSSAVVDPDMDKTAGGPEPEVRNRVRKDRGDTKGKRRRKRQAEGRARKIAGVTKKEWDQLKKDIRGHMD